MENNKITTSEEEKIEVIEVIEEALVMNVIGGAFAFSDCECTGK